MVLELSGSVYHAESECYPAYCFSVSSYFVELVLAVDSVSA